MKTKLVSMMLAITVCVPALAHQETHVKKAPATTVGWVETGTDKLLKFYNHLRSEAERFLAQRGITEQEAAKAAGWATAGMIMLVFALRSGLDAEGLYTGRLDMGHHPWDSFSNDYLYESTSFPYIRTAAAALAESYLAFVCAKNALYHAKVLSTEKKKKSANRWH